jgi:hypothetical protein
MSDPRLYEQAAYCFRQAGYPHDAVRCYRLAGAYRRAADLNVSLGEFHEAAEDYEQAGMAELGAWLLAHRVGDVAAARAMLGRDPSFPQAPVSGVVGRISKLWRGEHGQAQMAEDVTLTLRRRLVLARCAVEEGARPESILPVVGDVCATLADPEERPEHHTEEWAVALCEHVRRYDQAALVFAAAVRGGRYGADRRWKEWGLRVLGTELTIPSFTPPAPRPRTPSVFTASGGPSVPATGAETTHATP